MVNVNRVKSGGLHEGVVEESMSMGSAADQYGMVLHLG